MRFRGRVSLTGSGIPYSWELTDRKRWRVVAWGEEFTLSVALAEVRAAVVGAELWHTYKRPKSEHYRVEMD